MDNARRRRDQDRGPSVGGFRDFAARNQNREELVAELKQIFAGKNAAEWE